MPEFVTINGEDLAILTASEFRELTRVPERAIKVGDIVRRTTFIGGVRVGCGEIYEIKYISPDHVVYTWNSRTSPARGEHHMNRFEFDKRFEVDPDVLR